jgi:apolipoprotein N-acyltransferase
MTLRAPLWYLRLLFWLLVKAGVEWPVAAPAIPAVALLEPEVAAILPRVRGLVERADLQFPGPSAGERRRAWVLSELAEDYPTSRLRDRSYAVELAVRGR